MCATIEKLRMLRAGWATRVMLEAGWAAPREHAGSVADPMERHGEVTTRSKVEAEPTAVWEWATSAHGINFELGPLVRTGVPRRLEQGLAGVEPGEPLRRSWIRLLGVLPVDYDDIALERVEPGRGFLERSSLLTHRVWEHERTIEPSAAGLFRHRHARLRRRFGGCYLGQAAA